MATQRSKKSESSQSKSSSGTQHGRSGGSSKRGSGSARNPDQSPSRAQHGRAGKQESRSRASGRGNDNSSRGEQKQEGGGMLSRVTGGAKEAGSKAVDTVKQHPVSAAMIGASVAGLGLLAAKLVRDWSGGSEESEQQARQNQGDEAQDQAGTEEGEEQSEQLEDPGPEEDDESNPEASGEDRAGDESDEGEGGGIVGRARGAWGAVKNSASSVGQSVEQGYEYGKDKIGSLWEDHPLAVSAGLLALGVAAGMLIPATRAEKKILGRTSGKLTDKLRTAGRELFEQGSELAGRVVSEAGNAIREEAEREGLSPDKLARKVKRVANRIKDVISDTVNE